MKKLIMTGCVLLALTITGCNQSHANRRTETRETARLVSQSHDAVGMPNIQNFQEKRIMRTILELRDQANLSTFTYITTLDGKLVFIGNSIGYGLPASVQFTAPHAYSGGSYSLPQAEANGLYMPEGLSATWIMLVNPESGEAEPVYIEQEIIVSPFRLN